jgi:hypothetical protein
LKFVLALYMLAAAFLPFGHHDLVCHLKSTTHCTTCSVGSAAEAAADPAVLARFWLHDAGVAIADLSMHRIRPPFVLPSAAHLPRLPDPTLPFRLVSHV